MIKKVKLPDKNNVDELKEFFVKYDSYTNFEISLRFKVPIKTIQNWRKKCGMCRKRQSNFTNRKYEKKNYEIISDPIIWDNHDWFYQKYVIENLGIRIISKILGGKSLCTIYYRLKKYNIPIKTYYESIKIKHKCFNKEWIYKCYFKDKLSIVKMAKLAGVNAYTIYDWLIKFDIYPRGPREQSYISYIRMKHASSLSRTSQKCESTEGGT